MTKAVHLTSVHIPLDNRILHKECKTLAQDGYEVVLIAPEECFNDKIPWARFRFVRKPRNRFMRITTTLPAVFIEGLRERGSIYHFHDPELIPVGLLLKICGKKVIYDVHEDLPKQILHKSWISPWLRRSISLLAGAAEKLAALILDGIVVANPDVVHRFPQHKTRLVQNFPILSELGPDLALPYSTRPFTMTYVGNITEVRGIESMVAAADRLRKWPGVQLVLGGTFSPPGLEARAKTWTGWDLVEWRGFLSRKQVATAFSTTRVGLVIFHAVPHHLMSQPTKVFEYMAAGIPVVTSKLPVLSSIVKQAGCGFAVDPLNPQAIAEAVDWLFSNPDKAAEMGKQGREFALSNYSWQTEAQHLLALYAQIAPPSSTSVHTR